MNSGESSCAFQSLVNQVPPKVLTTVVSGAISSPQPGSPRRQMPFIPGLREPSTLDAMSATCCQVGCSGISRSFSASTSLRYIRNDDSP
ncbi:hypothetical protein SANTM175S_07897 [Streptomyces antimycoticus]